MNNPINYIDPLGMDTISINNVNWPIFNPENDVIALNTITVMGNNESSFGTSFNFISWGSGVTATSFTTSAGYRFTERPFKTNILGEGYFRTTKGVRYPLEVLKPRSNGKYINGIQGLRIGAASARSSTAIFARAGNLLGGINTMYSASKFVLGPNWKDGADIGVGIASYFFWEIGAAYASVGLYLEAVAMPNISQIQQNIMNNRNPTYDVYNPVLGDYMVSPFDYW